jgi:hypothetical protein
MTLLNAPAADGRWIAGIYNYCDRWCERCQLTSRCRLFARTEANGPPVTADEALADVGKHLLEAMEMVRDRAVEHGLDPSAPSDPADIQKERACDELARQHPLLVAAAEYAGMAGAWLAANAPEYRPARLAPAGGCAVESRASGRSSAWARTADAAGKTIRIIEWHRFQIAGSCRAASVVQPVDAGRTTRRADRHERLSEGRTAGCGADAGRVVRLMHLGGTRRALSTSSCASALGDGLELVSRCATFARPGFDTGDRPWPVLR